jgi:valyl-tRNA synthetase
MSKSLGNGIDPLEMVDKYGADALRMNMITGNSPGNDMRFYVERCEAMRNFANKIWNASRYVMMNLTIEENKLPDVSLLEQEDKWILSKLNRLIGEVTENMDKYELGIAVQKIYDFIWDDYCDWYIELTKARLYAEDQASKETAQRVLVYVLDQFLKLLHPYMPFITEEIWQAIPHEGESIMVAPWPTVDERLNFPAEEDAMDHIMAAIRSVRNRRAEMNVPPSKKSTLYIVTDNQGVYNQGKAFIMKLAYSDNLVVTGAAPENADGMVSCVTSDAKLYMPMDQLVDLEKELQRVEKELAKNQKSLEGIEKKLSNPGFLAKAPENVVNGEKEKAEKLRALIAQLEESKARLQK